ncbi:potassium voltage-gated channel subfamily KQT member 5 [Platysternon megacephalum]|uniref:Potassium voltage-gated channel subfamily KQT member 5 n=1 Tax=Platysternon megacephalum TaxID=55544 RepID=A0A4D9F3R3_9SAUR|nr:potassium voltage-gated channel subfamily KQT member 5 [Platysternon megacephalum]
MERGGCCPSQFIPTPAALSGVQTEWGGGICPPPSVQMEGPSLSALSPPAPLLGEEGVRGISPLLSAPLPPQGGDKRGHLPLTDWCCPPTFTQVGTGGCVCHPLSVPAGKGKRGLALLWVLFCS